MCKQRQTNMRQMVFCMGSIPVCRQSAGQYASRNKRLPRVAEAHMATKPLTNKTHAAYTSRPPSASLRRQEYSFLSSFSYQKQYRETRGNLRLWRGIRRINHSTSVIWLVCSFVEAGKILSSRKKPHLKWELSLHLLYPAGNIF